MKTPYHIYPEDIPKPKDDNAFEEGRTIPFEEPEESESEEAFFLANQ